MTELPRSLNLLKRRGTLLGRQVTIALPGGHSALAGKVIELERDHLTIEGAPSGIVSGPYVYLVPLHAIMWVQLA